MPWVQIKTGSAQEQLAEFDRLVIEYQRISQLPLDQQQLEYAKFKHHRTSQSGKYWPLNMLLVMIDDFSDVNYPIQERMLVDAMRLAIALEQHRRRMGQYPAALTDLIPHDLAEIPEDLATGKGNRLLYKLIDGKPIIYSRGHDGVDDALEPALRIGSKNNGDWQLYPPKLD